MSIKKRLWLGFLANLLVLPIFIGEMLWAVGSADEVFGAQHASVQTGRLAGGLQRELSAVQLPVDASAARRYEAALAQLDPDRKDPELNHLREALSSAGGAALASVGRLETAVAAGRARLASIEQGSWEVYDANQERLLQIKGTTQAVYGVSLPLAVALAVCASVLISRSITRPIDALTRSSRQMAAGDLREDVPLPGDHELRTLAQALNTMREQLARTISRVKTHSFEVSSTTAAVATATTQMARGAQEQSAATEETSSAMEEIAAQIQGVSRNAVDLADDASTAASGARQIGAAADRVVHAAEELEAALARAGEAVQEVAATAHGSSRHLEEVTGVTRQINGEAESGGAALGQSIVQIQAVGSASRSASAAFEALGHRSKRVGGIVRTMAEIADQTNLLALNAAIEAARAGDSGRGFAVVADEVRKLAERAVSAAREVAELIGGMQEETDAAVLLARENAVKTEEGARLLTETGGRMGRVVESIHRVGGLVSQVAAAVSEQSRAAAGLEGEVERIRRLATTLSQTAKDQVDGARRVGEAMDRISARTRQVADATVQVRAGGDQVLKAVENISVVARQNQEGVHRVSDAMQSLAARVGELQGHAQSLLIQERA